MGICSALCLACGIATSLAGVSTPPEATIRSGETRTADSGETSRIAELEGRLAELERRVGEDPEGESWSILTDPAVWFRRFTLGGYGEIHANMAEGPSNDQIDIHRLVIYLGYEFESWLQLHSEVEIEHGFVSDDDGEIVIEQLALDFSITDAFNVRAGRVLTPVGIINEKHEPPSFNGVERPLFATVIVPSTWSSDGVGVFGRLAPEVRYQLYVVGGLDGSGFSSSSGIRGGRIKERPSLNEPAVTGRVDYFPFARRPAPGQTLRLGLSGYAGGIDNGDQGRDPDVNGEVCLGAIDFQYSIGIVDFRGAAAYTKISGTNDIGNGVATDIYGYYLEAAVHVLPDSCKTGRLSEADLVLFTRYDRANTQYRRRSGVVKDDSGDREEVTIGFGWFFNPSIVFKGDVQIRNDAAAGDLPTLVNLGFGWEF